MRIAIDCEFSFDADSEFVCICACTTQEDGKQFNFWRTEMDALRDYIVSHKGDTFVAHSVETAEGYLFQSLGLQPTKFRWHDTLLMSRIVHNSCAVDKPLHGLDRCLAREHIVEIDHDTKKENQSICIWKQDCSWMDHITQMDAHKDHLLKYCLSDTEHLLELDDKLNAKLVASLTPGKWNHIDFDKPLEPSRRADYYGFLAAMASETSWRGIPLDPERVAHIKNNAPHAIAKMQLDFLRHYPYTFRKEGDKLKMNTAKCREYAAKVYGDKPPRTKTGFVSLASEYTEPHKDCDDFLGHYYNLMKACRALASFAKPSREKNWLGFYLPKRGIIRPRLNLLGTATGRCSSKPSTGFVYTMGKAFRGLVNPPEGKVLVELDFHSQEIGIQCYLSHDKRMAKLYEGPDYYTSIAHSIDPSITQKKDPRRDQYKRVCLMSNYGAGVDHLAEVSKLSKTKAAHVLQHLKTMFSTYWQYVEACKQSCTRSRYLWFSDGFRINFNGGKATSLCNWPFQGCGAYILRQMMVELYKAKIELVAPVHDAIVFMADEATWKETADKAAEIMKSVSLRAVGTVIDVGAPEVTFHGVVNCHSELSSREAYAKTDPNKYKLQYDKFMEDVECMDIPDMDNLYVDEEWKKEESQTE
mgnify:CR=1 FL=1